MSIGTGVIVAVAFEQVDRAPDTKTGTKRHDESLQYTDCTVEKCHKVFPPLFAPPEAGDRVDRDEKSPPPAAHVHLCCRKRA